MATPRIKSGTWVVVCDGRKAIFLENAGNAAHLDLHTREVSRHEDQSTRDLGSDQPGRVHQRFGPARSAVDQTDWHDREETDFLVEMLASLDAAITAGEVESMVIVAPPRALGKIRKQWSAKVRNAVIAEIDKDLTGMPVDEIERHLSAD